MIYVSESQKLTSIQPIRESTFSALGVWERSHMEEWIRQAPQMLGEELLIVSTEFDRFEGSKDRLDLLAVDRAGNLVVVELKRNALDSYADLQALRYAAMISAMTVETLLPHFRDYLVKKLKSPDTTEEQAREQIVEFVDSETFVEFSNRPRVILCAENFSPEITTTVLWLRQYGVGISCVKVTPHKLKDDVVVVSTRLIPLEEAKDYLVNVQKKEVAIQIQSRRKRPATITLLVEAGLLKAGEPIYLKNALPAYIQYDAANPVFEATITGKLGQSDAVVWKKDGQEYSISGLTHWVFQSLHPEQKDPGGVTGGVYWVNSGGVSLWDLAEEHFHAQTLKGSV